MPTQEIDANGRIWVKGGLFFHPLNPIETVIDNITNDPAVYDHIAGCLQVSGWSIETLSHNIESNFPDLDIDQCNLAAKIALTP